MNLLCVLILSVGEITLNCSAQGEVIQYVRSHGEVILSVGPGEIALNCSAQGEVILSVRSHGEVILSVGPGQIAFIAALMVKLFYLQT